MKLNIYVLVSLAVFCSATEIDFTLEVSPSRKECFYQTIQQGSSVDLEYQVCSWVSQLLRVPTPTLVLNQHQEL